jgi:phosphoglycolate phosphatase-like HAD superfamily hydrolase
MGRRDVTTNGAPLDTAVIWDFDGTLVDSHPKNLNVNRTIVETLTGRSALSFPALASIRAYEQAVSRAQNWREFYSREFDLREPEVERAGRLWPDLQRSDPTPHTPFRGVPEALEALSDLPHAILSHNDSKVISAALDANGLAGHFSAILGHAELGSEYEKPAAAGLLRCIELLSLSAAARVFFVGDHETDTLCASNARAALHELGSAKDVVSIGAFFGEFDGDSWKLLPDHAVKSPAEIVEIVRNGCGG